MGDTGRVVSIRLPQSTVDNLDHIVAMERAKARPGHQVTRSDLAKVAVEMFIAQRLRHVSRGTAA